MFNLVTLFAFQTMVKNYHTFIVFWQDHCDSHVLGKMRRFRCHYTGRYMIPASWQDEAKSFFTSQAADQEISNFPCIPVLLLCLLKPTTASYYDSVQSIRSITPCFIMTHFNIVLPSTIQIIPFFYLNSNQLDALNFIMSLFHASTCFGHKCSSSGGQNCTIQSLVSSHL